MTKVYFNYIDMGNNVFRVVFYNGVNVGDIIMNDDGYYVFFPENRCGYWEAWEMREIADKLDKMNKEWDEIVTNDTNI